MSAVLKQINVFPYMLGLKGPSGWGSGSTAIEIATNYKESINGKIAIVTGSNTGIGLETVRVLAMNGVKVYMAIRNLSKGEKALETIKEDIKDSEIHLMKCDLSSFDSIREFVKDFKALNVPLHLLINNAGIMACPLQYTTDGHEMQFGVNHLGHFLLTELLLDVLKASEPSRIINVASLAHARCYRGGIQYDDLKGEKKYDESGAYGQSKLSNILYTKDLNERLSQCPENVTAYSLHPGIIITELYQHLGNKGKIFGFISHPFQKNVPQGASTTVYLACAPNIEDKSGTYWADCNEQPTFRSKYTENPEEWRKLTKVSKELTGI